MATGEPIGDLEEEEISITSNNYCDYSKLSGNYVAEKGDYLINLPISDNQSNNPTMSSNPGNTSQAAGATGANGSVLPIDNNRRENAETMEEDDVLPIIGSKSPVTAKKGFTPFFKSVACKELPQYCSHPSCFSKALTLTESYEAETLCRVIALLESGERGVAEFAKMSWIPQGIKGATLSDMKARKHFLLGKAAHTPGQDCWKQWFGENFFLALYIGVT